MNEPQKNEVITCDYRKKSSATEVLRPSKDTEKLMRAKMTERAKKLKAQQKETRRHHKELKTLQQSLDIWQNNYVNLFNLAPTGLLTLYDDISVKEANTSLAMMLNATPMDILGQPLTDFAEMFSRVRLSGYLEEAFKGSCQPLEITLKRTDETTFPAIVHATLIKDNAQANPCCLCAVTDLTDLTASEEALDQQQRDLARLRQEHDDQLETANKLTGQVKEHESTISRLTSQYDQASEQIEDLALRIKETEEQFAGQATTAMASQQELQLNKEELTRANDEKQKLIEFKGELEEKITQQTELLDDHKQKYARADMLLSQQGQQLQSLQEDVQNEKDRTVRLRDRLTEVNGLVKLRTAKLEATTKELRDQVSKRRRLKASVDRLEQDLAMTQRHTAAGTWQMDLRTRQLVCSDQLYRIFGLKPQMAELNLADLVDAVHQDDRKTVKDVIKNAVKAKSSCEHDHRIIQLDGEIVHVRLKGRYVAEDNSFVGTICDTTEHVGNIHDLEVKCTDLTSRGERLSAELSQTNEKLDGVKVERDKFQNQLVLKNAELEDVSSQLAIESGRYQKLESDMAWQSHEHEMAITEKTQRLDEFSAQLQKQTDKHSRYCARARARASKLKKQVEDLTTELGTLSDRLLEQTKKADHAVITLEACQNLLGYVSTSIPFTLSIFDRVNQRTTFVGDHLGVRLGYSQRQIERMGEDICSELIHPDDIAEMAECLEEFDWDDFEGVLENQFRLKAADGSWKHVIAVELVFSRDEQGSPDQILTAHIDVSAQKEAEQIIENLQSQLEQKHAQLCDIHQMVALARK